MLLLACVLAISCGQILFKRAGLELQLLGTWQSLRVWAWVGVAGLIYGTATLLWIHLLRYLPLSQAYPFMALSFVVVPVVSHLLFDETLHLQQVFGMCLVLLGLLVMTRAVAEWLCCTNRQVAI